MMMLAATFSNTVSLGNLLTAFALVVLSVPASLIAMSALRADRHARRVTEVANDVLTMLNGNKPVTQRTPEDPSMIDLMRQVADNTRRYVDLADDLDQHTSNPLAHRQVPVRPPRRRQG